MNSNKTSARQSLILLIGILLIATTLRAPITGVAPVLEMIREDFSFSPAIAGILTTLPLLAFAVVSPFAVILSRKTGLELSLFIALILITVGIALRMIETVWCLFLGTAIIGSGIAIANVLLPSLLKRDFPSKIASITGAYSVTAGIAAALASAAAIPIANYFNGGWNWALGAFIIFPIATLAIWLMQLSAKDEKTPQTATSHSGKPIWNSPLAWQVTFFFGLNSLVYYVIVTWLPAILQEAGFSPTIAGSFHGISQLATAIPGLVFGLILARFNDQKIIAVLLPMMTALSLAGILVLPQWASLWAAIFGFGCGATFILALAFISLRTSNPGQAAALSGMAQCIGYTIAAGAPPAAGFIYEYTQGWIMPLIICIFLSMVMAVLGYCAGRSIRIK